MNSQQVLAWRAPLLMAGVGLSAFTSGAIASFSLVTIPAILTNTTNSSLLTCWSHTLHNGVKVGPTFAIGATLVHILNAVLSRDSPGRAKYSVAAAVSTITIVPFTILVLAPTNQELFKREKAAANGGTASAGVEASTVELVKKWGRINLARAYLPAVGALVACFAM